MGIKFEFELDDQDLVYFQGVVDRQGVGQGTLEIRDIVGGTQELLRKARQEQTPTSVLRSLEQLGPLVEMVTDPEWKLPADDVARVLHALAYFSDPDDLIPDDVPGLGFLDDAVMVELACINLRPELDAYRDFCRFRDEELERRKSSGEDVGSVSRLEWLESRREELHNRMRRHRGLFGRKKKD
jgi:uncharacterized membrane protein YkvA (DUF1232 family)